MERPRIYIGVDGGGSVTRAIGIDHSARLVGVGRSSGSNPNNGDLSSSAESILAAIRQTGANVKQVASLHLGIAGVGSESFANGLRDEILRIEPSLSQATISISHDLDIALEGALCGSPGICLVAGTGSACYGRKESGETYRESGRAFSYEDPGSGYAIAKRAIDSGLLAAPSVTGRSEIAALSKSVIELADKGHSEALALLTLEASNLVELARPILSEFEGSASDCELVLVGGMLERESVYRSLIKRALNEQFPKRKISPCRHAPVMGALQHAWTHKQSLPLSSEQLSDLEHHAVSIRPALRRDALEIATIHLTSWRSAYRHIMPLEIIETISLEKRLNQWTATITEDSANQILVAENIAGAIVGFALWGPCGDPDVGDSTTELLAIYMRPEHFGLGIGSRLLREVESSTQSGEIVLWVLVANVPGRHFYSQRGYTPDGAERPYQVGNTSYPSLRYRKQLAT